MAARRGRGRTARLASVAAATLCALAGATTAAGAREPVETILQDDALLLHRSDDEVAATMRQLRSLGVDRVRLTAGWSTIAPSPDSMVAPLFDAADPDAYPRANWRNLDRAVRLAGAAGLEVMIDVAFWAPAWATSRAPLEGRARENVDPRRFAAFVEAVVTRYSGSFTPEPDDGSLPAPSKDRVLIDDLLAGLPAAAGSPAAPAPPAAAPAPAAAPLPRVRWWTIWNEPNLEQFLRPQYERTAGGLQPVSPHLYRAMVEATYPAIKATQPDSTVLVGGTAAIGARTPTSETSAMPPLRFLRELACVDEALRPIATGRCEGFRPVPGDGFSHHPYSLRSDPSFSDPRNPDRVPIGALDRLTSTLDQLVAAGRIAPGLRDVYLTEFGYESNPPKPDAPFGLEQQARLINRAERLAWANPRVRAWPQFLLRDSADPALYQTGLLFADGRPKPALRSFELALVADCVVDGAESRSRRRAGRGKARARRGKARARRGKARTRRRARSRRRARRAARPRTVLVWGHVRSPGAARSVSLSVLRRGRWTPLARATTRPDGVFVRRVPFERGVRYRAEAVAAGGSPLQSLDVAAGGCRIPAI